MGCITCTCVGIRQLNLIVCTDCRGACCTSLELQVVEFPYDLCSSIVILYPIFRYLMFWVKGFMQLGSWRNHDLCENSNGKEVVKSADQESCRILAYISVALYITQALEFFVVGHTCLLFCYLFYFFYSHQYSYWNIVIYCNWHRYWLNAGGVCICMCECMYVCVCVCIYLCMYACMYVCMWSCVMLMYMVHACVCATLYFVHHYFSLN